jgi:Tfp pilus assembly protein PilO
VKRPLWRRVLLPLFLALVGLNLAVAAAWTAPRTYRLRNVSERTRAAEVSLARARETAARLRERAEAIRANTVDLERFYRNVVGSEDQDLLPTLEEIEKLASGPGLHPRSRGFDREEIKDTHLQKVAVKLPLEGSYAQLLDFLRGAEHSPRFLTIDRVSMRAEREGGASLQVEISTYVRTEGERKGNHGR